jgi:hypothetical protein
VIIETDTSDFALRAVLSQWDDENRLDPVAFHSRKFQPAEINYEIHDKKLLAIVDAFKHWRWYCEGATHQVQVFSDPQNLEYFTTTKVLNRRLKRTGCRSLPALISKSTTDLGLRIESRMLSQDVLSTTLKKGGVKINQSPRFYTKKISRQHKQAEKTPKKTKPK